MPLRFLFETIYCSLLGEWTAILSIILKKNTDIKHLKTGSKSNQSSVLELVGRCMAFVLNNCICYNGYNSFSQSTVAGGYHCNAAMKSSTDGRWVGEPGCELGLGVSRSDSGTPWDSGTPGDSGNRGDRGEW